MKVWTAFLPFLTLFFGLTLTRIPSYLISLFTLLLAAFIAVWNGTDMDLILHALLYGSSFALLPILWVIFAAVFTYFVSVKSGAMETIKAYLTNLSDDENIQAVIIAFCLGGFLESVAGFGTAVAIPTVMLISIGIPAIRAAVIALVANSVPVAFGALGIPVIALAELTHLDLALLTKYVAIQLLPFALLVPAAIVWINSGSFRKGARSLPEALGIGGAFSIIQTMTAFWIGPELVALLGALGSLLVYVLWKKIADRKKNSQDATGPATSSILKALSNYIILFILVMLTRVLLPLAGIESLKRTPFLLLVPIGTHNFKIDWLTTPGTLLILSTLCGAMFQNVRAGQVFESFFETLSKIKFSAMTIVCIVSLAYVMGDGGMIAAAASILAQTAGSLYPLLAPAIGGLGTFVTGSDTTSNILLGGLQKETALKLTINPEWIAASNTSGATAGKMISPQSIAIAAGTVGIRDEKAIMRKTLLFCAIYLFLLGLFVYSVSINLK